MSKLIKLIKTEDLRKAAYNLQDVMGCFDPEIDPNADRQQLIRYVCTASGLVFPEFDKLEYNTWKVLYFYTEVRPSDFPIENFLKMLNTSKKQKKTPYGTFHRWLRNKKWSTKEEILEMLKKRFPREKYLESMVKYWLNKYEPRKFIIFKDNGKYYVEDKK